MVGAAVALLVAFFVGGAVVRVGPRLGFVDLPDGFLKPHAGAAVPLGGVAVFAAVHTGLVTAGRFDTGLLAASGILLVLGLADDRRSLSPRLRLGVTVVAGMVLGLAADLPASTSGTAAVVLAVVLTVVTVNAVNLFDGLDGLAGSVALVTAAGIAVLAAFRGTEMAVALVLAAGIAGFLLWNWPPARLFLGDNGAYTVAVFLVYGFFQASPAGGEVPTMVAACLLGMFAIDLIVTLLRRGLASRPLFTGDRSHIYDQLRDRGWSVTAVSMTMAGAQAAFVAVVVAIDQSFPPPTALAASAAVAGLIIVGLGAAGFLRPDPDSHTHSDRSAGQ